MAFKVGSNSAAVIPDDKTIYDNYSSLRGFDQYLTRYPSNGANNYFISAKDPRSMNQNRGWVGDRWRAADTINNYRDSPFDSTEALTFLPLFGDGKIDGDVYSKSNCRRWYITGMGRTGSWSSNYYLRWRLYQSNYVGSSLTKSPTSYNWNQTLRQSTAGGGGFADRTNVSSVAIFPIGTTANASVLNNTNLYGAFHGVITVSGQYGNHSGADLSGPTDSDNDAASTDCKNVTVTWEVVHQDVQNKYHLTHGVATLTTPKRVRWLGIDTANSSVSTHNIFGHSYDLVSDNY